MDSFVADPECIEDRGSQVSPARGIVPDWRPIVIVLVGLLFRVIYYVTFKPQWCGDSHQYSDDVLLWVHYSFFTGYRTPIYSLFLGVSEWLARVPAAEVLSTSAAEIVRDVQSVLGLVTACLFYCTLRILNVRKPVAFAAGLFFSTTSAICSAEASIVTPSLSLLSLVLAASLYVKIMARIGCRGQIKMLAIGAGIAFASAALVRPDNLVFFAAILAATAAFALRSTLIPARWDLSRRLLVGCLLLLISATPFLIAWMTCNYLVNGRFRMTNMMGWQTTQSVYNMYGEVDPEDKVLGSIMNKYYVQTNRGRVDREYVWEGAAKEVMARASEMPYLNSAEFCGSGNQQSNWACMFLSPEARTNFNQRLGWEQLFDYLTHVWMKLITKHPSQYLHNALDSFVGDTFDFSFMPPDPAETNDPRAVEGGNVVRSRAGWRVVYWTALAQAPFLMVFYLITLAYVFLSPLILLNPGNNTRANDVAVTALALGSVGTFVAFCLLESYHKQYGLPHLGVFMICAAYAAENFNRIVGALKGTVQTVTHR